MIVLSITLTAYSKPQAKISTGGESSQPNFASNVLRRHQSTTFLEDRDGSVTALPAEFPWQVVAELPADSVEADEECRRADGKTLLYIFGRG